MSHPLWGQDFTHGKAECQGFSSLVVCCRSSMPAKQTERIRYIASHCTPCKEQKLYSKCGRVRIKRPQLSFLRLLQGQKFYIERAKQKTRRCHLHPMTTPRMRMSTLGKLSPTPKFQCRSSGILPRVKASHENWWELNLLETEHGELHVQSIGDFMENN